MKLEEVGRTLCAYSTGTLQQQQQQQWWCMFLLPPHLHLYQQHLCQYLLRFEHNSTSLGGCHPALCGTVVHTVCRLLVPPRPC
jgi:hypothetical protein